MRIILAAVVNLVVGAGAQGAAGQTFDGAPTWGEFRLSAESMTPDAHLLALTAGGEVEAATRPGADPDQCKGFTAASPDAQLVWSGADGVVRLSAMSNADTVLVVRTPDGALVCDDDSGEDANPSIPLTVRAGRYDIWVGAYSQGERKKAVLSVAATESF